MAIEANIDGAAVIRPDRIRRAGIVALGIWAAIGLAGAYHPARLPEIMQLRLPDTDDVMRLVGVRDLLAGQGWFDNVQHRLLPPEGVPSHWSRLVDLPLALLILVLSPLVGRGTAEGLTVALWPPLLFALYLALVWTFLRGRLGHVAALAGLVVATQSPVLGGLFAYGRIDHHNAQVCAVLGMTVCLCGRERPARAGACAGALAGLSLAIGLETVPVLAAAGLFLVAEWVRRGRSRLPMLLGFGTAFGAAATLLFLAQTAPVRWAVPACDALSPPWLLVAGGAALATSVLAGLGERLSGPAARGAAAASLGLGGMAAFALMYPACAAGPFAGMDDLVRSAWLDEVFEMWPASRRLASNPAEAFAGVAPLLVASLYATAAALRSRESTEVRTLALLATLAWPGTLLALVEARGAYIGASFVPLVAGIAAARTCAAASQGRPLLAPALAAFGMVGTVWGIVVAGLGGAAPPPTAWTAWRRCTEPAALRALDVLPPGLVLADLNLGPPILLRTRHAVVAAPYHRDLAGLRMVLVGERGSAEELRGAAIARPFDYLVLCEPMLRAGSGTLVPTPFLAALGMGRATAPSWLEPATELDPSGVLQVWRVRLP
ncbi:MAG: hypothetical protein JO048_05525 [Methylobacteriaceae bacterium]|nr:hypothetical protein [Methylobacteriaceae bacterium]